MRLLQQVAREIELQASLQHPSIVQIYAAFEDNEGIYVVQEFALGGDLYAQLAQAGGYLAEDQVACEVMLPVLAALGYMHDQVSMLNPIVALLYNQASMPNPIVAQTVQPG